MTATKKRKPARRRKKKYTQDPRPKPTDQERHDLLLALTDLARVRRETIDEVKPLRDEEIRRHRQILQEITQMHRDANDSLVRAVDLAYSRGVNKTDIYASIGISGQMLGKIRHRVENPIIKEER